MSYTIVPDKASSDTFFEANWDTSIKDNLNSGVWRPLGDVVLSAGASSISIASIPNTMAHLCVVGQLRDDEAVAGVETRVRFNGDTGSNYDHQQITNSNATTLTTAETFAGTSALIGAHCGASSPASQFGGFVAYITHYAGTSNNKSFTSFSGYKISNASAGANARIISGHWRNNSAINQVTILPGGSGSFVAGSRVIVYGMGNV